MRHPISWADLRHERVVVWGLGMEGRANVARLRALGLDPVIVDDDPSRLSDETALPTIGDGFAAMRTASAVVKTPGISRYRPEAVALEAAGIPVLGGMGLWLEELGEAGRAGVVSITGTKGKSTTTSVLAHLARGLGVDAVAGGNIGAPPWAPDAPATAALWVIETSSYQATDVASTPPLTIVTSLSPDHLPWHGDEEAYYRDKLSLCSQPGASRTIAAVSAALRARAALLGPEVTWVEPPAAAAWAAPLHLVGAHNAANAALARAALAAHGIDGVDDDAALEAAAEGYQPLSSRLEHVACVGGVDCYDDSLSTNVLPTIAAVAAFPHRRVALIAGGFDRDLDYTPLAAALADRDVAVLVLTVYDTGPRVRAAIDARRSPRVEAVPCADLRDAVLRGWQWAQPDGVLLLSPAAASFGAFTDYAHRGRAFRDAVADLPTTATPRTEPAG